jgi:serine/threonine protein kinase
MLDLLSSLGRYSAPSRNVMCTDGFLKCTESMGFTNWSQKIMIGRGSFGKVYRYSVDYFGESIKVAVKEIVFNQVDNELSKNTKEIELGYSMGDLGIGPEIYGTFFEINNSQLTGTQYVIMEPMDTNGHDYLASPVYSKVQKKFVVGRMIDILNKQIFHHGIFCFDVKPGNYLVNISPLEVKMIDFGDCSLADDPGIIDFLENKEYLVYLIQLIQLKIVMRNSTKLSYTDPIYEEINQEIDSLASVIPSKQFMKDMYHSNGFFYQLSHYSGNDFRIIIEAFPHYINLPDDPNYATNPIKWEYIDYYPEYISFRDSLIKCYVDKVLFTPYIVLVALTYIFAGVSMSQLQKSFVKEVYGVIFDDSRKLISMKKLNEVFMRYLQSDYETTTKDIDISMDTFLNIMNDNWYTGKFDKEVLKYSVGGKYVRTLVGVQQLTNDELMTILHEYDSEQNIFDCIKRQFVGLEYPDSEESKRRLDYVSQLVQTSNNSTPHIPSLHIPSPHIPSPHIPSPHIPSPRANVVSPFIKVVRNSSVKSYTDNKSIEKLRKRRTSNSARLIKMYEGA